MRKPDDIPQDVWDEAVAVMRAVEAATNINGDGTEFVAVAVVAERERATVAERERCAKIVESSEIRSLAYGGTRPIFGRTQLAAAIRAIQ